ncbi:effector-binding domain-containing protein [Arthrobacter sp. PvP023]|uniref:GyrI-like domain-containing protein n=1 Tax=Micrococcaceae TaxID=1268 RepID=UPI001AE821D1|nr:GyrI-like domain-containing protein [Arthrobacter sp. PvP023]MBP1137578.1 effector-binding domain-containing protein [Arthrobacter sp. PvP023]
MSQDKTGVRLVQRPEQPTAVIREKVPMNELQGFFGRAFGAVMAAARDQGVQISGPPFGLYRGMPTDTVDVEAGFPVTAPVSASAGVEAGTLPACRAFEATHTGPYDTLVTTYDAIQERMTEEGFTPADSMWEYYLSDPAKEPDPATWKTLVVWPVA